MPVRLASPSLWILSDAHMQKGDLALAGEEERGISTHLFPPTTEARKVLFKGRYLSIVHKITNEVMTHEDNDYPTTEYKLYDVPAGCACYVRVADVCFKK